MASTPPSSNEARSPELLCKVHKPPSIPEAILKPSIFLAGSIEMGKAIDWQTKLTEAISHLPVSIFNPRRDEWDSSWVQDISNPHFREQVEWEMDHLEKADLVVLYLHPGTMSPISLLELGLHAKGGNVLVCCPEGFWRRGNVQVVCARYEIPLFDHFDDLVEATLKRIAEKIEA